MKKIHLLLLALFFIFAANAQMVLEYEIPEAGKSIALPLNGTVDVTVDWGDGSLESFTEAGNKEHTYITDGTKTVTITGTLTHFGDEDIDNGNQYLTKVISWDGLGLICMKNAFYNASFLTTVPVSLPTQVTDLSYMFKDAKSFNQDISGWNTVGVENMRGLFYRAISFNQPIGSWNTSSVTSMWSMFYEAVSFNQPIGDWNTKNVTIMRGLFFGATSFNEPIGTWNTSSVTDVGHMFSGAAAFNQPVGDWNTGNVKDMISMFEEAVSFNQPIGNWNTSSVTSMWDMFVLAESFNQPIRDWNTENVTTMSSMFKGAKSFDQDISSWNTGNVKSMYYMFSDAFAFNQPLGNWDISSVTNMVWMFLGTSLCTENYDATLNGWATQTIKEGLKFHGGNSKYSEASEAARAILAEKWSFSDGGLGITEDDKCATPVGTEAYLASENVEFYPNPVSDKLYINTTSLSSYAVYSLTGNLLEEAEGSKTQIDLSDLPSGIYILQTTSELGIRNQRFSKN